MWLTRANRCRSHSKVPLGRLPTIITKKVTTSVLVKIKPIPLVIKRIAAMRAVTYVATGFNYGVFPLFQLEDAE